MEEPFPNCKSRNAIVFDVQNEMKVISAVKTGMQHSTTAWKLYYFGYRYSNIGFNIGKSIVNYVFFSNVLFSVTHMQEVLTNFFLGLFDI